MTSTPSHQALYRRWRSQRFGEVVGQEAVVATLRNAIRSGRSAHAYLFVGPARDRQDVAGPDRGQGGQLPERRRGRAVRRLPELRRDPRGPGARRRRARRGLEQPGRRHPRAPAAHLHRARRPADEGLHRRRGPADHPGLGRPPQDARGAAAARPLHLLHDRQQPDPPRRDLPRPALRLPAAPAAAHRGQAAHGSSRPTGGPPSRPRSSLVARLANGGMRDAESILDQLLSAGGDELTADGVRDLLGPRRRRDGRRPSAGPW